MTRYFAYDLKPNWHRRSIPWITAVVLLSDGMGIATLILSARRGDWVFGVWVVQLCLVFTIFWATAGQNMCGSGRVWLLGSPAAPAQEESET